MERRKEGYYECSVQKLFCITSIITIFRKVFGKKYYYKGETHDFWEIICVLDGKAGVAVDDKVYQLKKDQILFVQPLEFHNLYSLDGTNPDILVMSFRLSVPFEIETKVADLDYLTKKELTLLFELAKEVFDFQGIQIKHIAEGKNIQAQIFTNRLEVLLLAAMNRESAENVQVRTQSALNYSKIQKILKENLYTRLTIKEIALLANMSESGVKKTFSMYANQGIIEYFNCLKIAEAKKLLSRGMSVFEVSQELGYIEQNYFSTVFKKMTGKSPKHWLKEML